MPRDSIDYLSLRGTDLTDAGLPHVATLTGLRVLDLDSTRIKGGGLEIKALSSLVQLEELRLSAFNVHKDGFGVGDRAMSAIAALPKLRSVRLRLTRVTDAGLAKLCKSKSLRTIGLEGTAVSDAGLVHLKQLPDLENLQLGVYRDGARVTDEGLKTIGQLNNLRYLDLSGTKVTNAGLVHLRPLERLESLSLENTEVTEVGLAALHPLKSLTRLRFYERVTDVGAEHLSKLASLKNISSNMEITDDGVAKLAQLRHLEELSLSEGGITDEATKHIANMESLIGLWFQDCPITDEGLGRLTALRNLERLMLHGTKVTGEGLRHLGSLPKLEWLSLDFGSTEPEETPAISLKHLEGLGSLTYLTIGNPIASAKGVLAGELPARLETQEPRDVRSRREHHFEQSNRGLLGRTYESGKPPH